MAVFFGGKFLAEPTAASVIDDSALESPGAVGLLAVGILGTGTGGTPQTPILLSNPAEAREKLRGGDLLQGALNAFSPSANVPGASFVFATRINSATAATLALLETATTVITLTSKEFGLIANQIQVKIETGTVTGKKITTLLGEDTVVQDDVAENAFEIQYTGADGTCTMTVTATTLTTTTGATPAEDISITLADFESFTDLANTINAFALGVYTFTTKINNPSQAPVLMDFVTAVDIKTSPVTHTQNLQSIIDYFNSAAEPFTTAVRGTAVGSVPDNIVFTPLAGGTEGTTTSVDWQTSIDAQANVEVRAFTVLTGDSSIHAQADAHAQAEALPGGGGPRRSITGGIAGETVALVTARAALLNSDRTYLVYPDFDDVDLDGVLQEDLAPFFLAAKFSGMTLGAGIGEPLTRKVFRAQGLSAALSSADKATLIQGGVIPVEFKEGIGFRIVQQVSTWLQSNNFFRVELSTGMAADEVVIRTQRRLDTLVGKKNSPVTLAQPVTVV